MRIDQGPTIEEIRQSVRTGRVVKFWNVHGKEIRGVVLSARFDHELNRAVLVLEEEDSHMLCFVRYRYVGRWSCGDIVKWQVQRNQIEELRREAS